MLFSLWYWDLGLKRLTCLLQWAYLVSEIQLVGVADQSAPEPERQLTLQKPDGAVDECSRNCNQEPLGQLQHKGLSVLLNDALNDHA